VTSDPVIRRATVADHAGIGDVWLASWRATFDFPPGHPDDVVRRWLSDHLVPEHETWVAVAEGIVVGLMARAFSERDGFTAVEFGDGSGSEERQPDIRYAWRP